MIVKKIKMKAASKSSFSNLTKYVLDTKDLNKIKTSEKLADFTFTNCDFENAKDNVAQIKATQKLNTTSTQEKTMHLVISFQEDERPSTEILRKIEKDFCKALGMAHHQRLSAVHDDTNNYHIHLAINKVCPKTLKVRNPYNDSLILQKAAAAIEKKYGLKVDNHEKRGQSKDLSNTNSLTMLEHFEGWCKDKLYQNVDDLLKNDTTSFKDIEILLAKHDLKFVERRRGFVIASRSRKLFTKASSIHRGLSKTALEKRFGNIKPSEDLNVQKELEFKMQTNNNLKASHWDDYKNADHLRTKMLNVGLSNIAKKQKVLTMSFKKGVKNKKEYEKLKLAAAILRRKKQALYKEYRYKSYRQYLEDRAFKGDEHALKTLQQRNLKEIKKDLLEDTLSGKPKNFELDSSASYITKEGFVVYKEKDNFNKIIDKGSRLRIVYNDKNSEEILLKSIHLAAKKYNNFLNLNGNPKFKNDIIKLVVKHNLNIKFTDNKLNSMVRNMKKGLNNDKNTSIKF